MLVELDVHTFKRHAVLLLQRHLELTGRCVDKMVKKHGN